MCLGENMGIGDKLKAMKMLKQVVHHLQRIEEADTELERRRAEREWENWKDSHPEELERIKPILLNEVVRLCKSHKDFYGDLMSELNGMHDESSGFEVHGGRKYE